MTCHHSIQDFVIGAVSPACNYSRVLVHITVECEHEAIKHFLRWHKFEFNLFHLQTLCDQWHQIHLFSSIRVIDDANWFGETDVSALDGLDLGQEVCLVVGVGEVYSLNGGQTLLHGERP